MSLLKETIGEPIITRRLNVAWPSDSCDLTPRYYSLRLYVKSPVYADKIETIDALEKNKENIRRIIADKYITPIVTKMVENRSNSWLKH